MAGGFKWNGKKITAPSGMNYTYEDICTSNTGRSLNAKMQKSVIASKVTLSLEWKCLSDEESSALLKAIKGSIYGKLEYPDPMEGENTIKTFYTASPQASYITDSSGNYTWDVSIEFIER